MLWFGRKVGFRSSKEYLDQMMIEFLLGLEVFSVFLFYILIEMLNMLFISTNEKIASLSYLYLSFWALGRIVILIANIELFVSIDR